MVGSDIEFISHLSETPSKEYLALDNGIVENNL